MENPRSTCENISYYKYVKSLGNLAIATSRLDDRITELRKKYNKNSFSFDDIEKRLAFRIDQVDEVLRATDPTSEDVRWNDYYRLKTRQKFAPWVIMAEKRSPKTDDSQTEFLHGFKDVGLDLVAESLEAYESMEGRVIDRNELHGTINELTAIALMNYYPENQLFMLPSSQFRDLTGKTDAYLYGITEHSDRYKTAVQIKSRRRFARGGIPGDKNEKPYITTLYATDFNNVSQLKISQLLVDLHNGKEMTNDDRHRIQVARNGITAAILPQQNQENTEYLSAA